MEKLATEETVWQACDQIEAEGRKVSGRAVQNEIGGSLSTILPLIKSWRVRDSKNTVAPEISADLLKSILLALGQSAKKATESLSIKLEEATECEREVLEDLAESEKLNATLGADLSAAKAHIIELQQRHDKESAVAAETNAGLREQIGKLHQEKNALTLSREEAKTEAVTGQLQLNRADQAATKSEEKVLELEKQASALIRANTEAEKVIAVAARHAEDLSGQIAKMEERLESAGAVIGRLESERSELTLDLNSAVSAFRKAEGATEQMTFRIQDGAATNGQLRKELENVRKESALITDQMILRIQAGETTINHLRKELELASKDTSEAQKLPSVENVIEEASSESNPQVEFPL